MKPEVIRSVLRRQPWHPLEFVLDNGERVPVPSPEILVADDLVVTLDKDNDAVLFSPEAVSLIRRRGKNGRREILAKSN